MCLQKASICLNLTNCQSHKKPTAAVQTTQDDWDTPPATPPSQNTIPIRERLAKWQEQNPQSYQQTLPTFHELSDPMKALADLIRRPAPEKFGPSESEEGDIEDWDGQGVGGSENYGLEDLAALSLRFKTGDLVDLM